MKNNEKKLSRFEDIKIAIMGIAILNIKWEFMTLLKP